jgi:alkylation response protein AidB-like acyl-CoA dehydrogenase
MDLAFLDAYSTFRDEVRQFIGANLSASVRRRVEHMQLVDRHAHTEWHRCLLRNGWAGPSWPKEHGGTGWSLEQQFVFEQELAAHHAPRQIFFGLDMLGPLLMEHGDATQKERFLGDILSGETWWCQGFSEPGAGSDLAALRCRAELDGDEYVINGSKIWTSGADRADWMGGLFRTDSTGRKQLGITLLLVPMDAPGLNVHPIRMFDGDYEVNQCFFDQVRVPVHNRVGPEGEGWSMAKYMLGVERLGIADVARTKVQLKRLERIAKLETSGTARLFDEAWFHAEFYQTKAELMALETTEHRFLFDPAYADTLGAEASILKIRGSELQQRVTEFIVQALAHSALPDMPEPDLGSNRLPSVPEHAAFAAHGYFNHRKVSIYGGSNEIQKNIVAKAVLGL